MGAYLAGRAIGKLDADISPGAHATPPHPAASLAAPRPCADPTALWAAAVRQRTQGRAGGWGASGEIVTQALTAVQPRHEACAVTLGYTEQGSRGIITRSNGVVPRVACSSPLYRPRGLHPGGGCGSRHDRSPSTPACWSSHNRNASRGTLIVLPSLIAGKSALCARS